MQNERRILIIDGDIHIGKFLKRQLGQKNYRVDFKTGVENVEDELRSNACDLLIMDVNLPGADGLDLLRKIRAARPAMPILVLTARSRTEDVVRGLDAGASDYLIKPFSFLELAARIRVLLLRTFVAPAITEPTIGNLFIDRDGHQVFRGSRRIDLTQREFEILEYLVMNAGKALSRKTLMEEVWKTAYDPATNIVDVYIKYLRDKIDIEGETRLIRTIRGVGYILSDGGEQAPRWSPDSAYPPVFQPAAVASAA